MRKLGLVLVLMLVSLTTNIAFGQVKKGFDGPTNLKPLQTAWITVGSDLGDDPKFDCFPANKNWRVMRDFDGQPMIWFQPQEDDGGKSFTFVFATNKDKKTQLLIHTINIGDPSPLPKPPNPPDPLPKPNPDVPAKYLDRLKGAYLVSPNKVYLNVLITMLTTVNNTKYSDANQFSVSLKANADKYFMGVNGVPDRTILRSTRDEITKIFEENNLNSLKDPWDQGKCEQVLKDIVESLKQVDK
jgi:hypothetical protein